MAAAVPEAQLDVTGSVEADEADDPSIAPGPATASDWGLTFSELTEEQLMNGFILRERLLKLLDHPSLTNHLLRAKNLLPLLVRLSLYFIWSHTDIKGLEVGCRTSPSSIGTKSHSCTHRIRPGRKCFGWRKEN